MAEFKKITTDELLERMKNHTEHIDLGFIANVCHDNDVSVSMTWNADGSCELWVSPSVEPKGEE